VTVHRIDLAYDGTGFHGYARNEGVRTVQGVLEAALATALGGDVTTVVAGRTDAGVHAREQVVSFEWDGPLDGERLARSLDGIVGPEIAVRSVTPAPEGFSARFSATGRTYRYFIDDHPSPDPLRRSWVWHLPEHLDLEAMNRAAAGFVGEHDFASLCRAAAGRSTVRMVRSARWEREGGLLVLTIEAGSFCHQMVRSIVAICVDAGRGKVAPDAVPGILAARDRHAARGVAPPHGLVLWEVAYG
jgi:tRNA pseudouridine38-40 synthase